GGLDNEVDVVALDREMTDAEALLDRAGDEGRAHQRRKPHAPQAADLLDRADGHVHDRAAADLRSPAVRHPAPHGPLASGPRAPPAPGPDRKLRLHPPLPRPRHAPLM